MTIDFNVPPKVVKGAHRGVKYELIYNVDAESERDQWRYVVTVHTPLIYENTARTETRCLRDACARIDELLDRGVVAGRN